MTADTNAERLEKVKSAFDSYKREYGLDREQIEFLIQQAERVRVVEEAARFTHNLQAERLQELYRENARLQDALELIANKSSCTVASGTARQTLKGESNS